MKYLFALTLILISSLSNGAQSTNENKGQWLMNGENFENTADQKAINGFGAALLVIKEPDKFVKDWMKPKNQILIQSKS